MKRKGRRNLSWRVATARGSEAVDRDVHAAVVGGSAGGDGNLDRPVLIPAGDLTVVVSTRTPSKGNRGRASLIGASDCLLTRAADRNAA